MELAIVRPSGPYRSAKKWRQTDLGDIHVIRHPSSVIRHLSSVSCRHQLQRKLVYDLMAVWSHYEGMAEENPEQAVRGDRIWLRHGHHAGQENLVVVARLGALREHMWGRGDDIDT